MRNPSKDSRIGLYRPGMSSPFRRKQLTVGRSEILLDTLDHLRSAADRKSKHHFLFLGPRGSGKSHLLAIIEDGIHEDPRLAPRIVVAKFPEEAIRTLSFADLLKKLVSILAERLVDEPQWQELSSKLVLVQDSNDVVDLVVPVLRRTNDAKKRTIIVMIENLNELFSKQIRQEQQIGAIRKFFMDKNGCLLIATALMHFDAVTDVSQPFYDFFDTQTLLPFDKEQSVTLLKQMQALDNDIDSNSDKDLSHLVMALHDMTCGNPRLMVMTCESMVHEGIESAKDILLKLIDGVSPIYQASLAEMAPQERALMETLASMRDKTPRTPANIAAKLGISERQTSSLLKRLTDARLVTFEINQEDKRSRSYCIRDGFLDIWLAVQSGDVVSRQVFFVAEFLASFYRRSDGPYLITGEENPQFKTTDDTDPQFPACYPEDTHRYLRFAKKQIERWVANRRGDLERLSADVIAISQVASNRAIGEWFMRTSFKRKLQIATRRILSQANPTKLIDRKTDQLEESFYYINDENSQLETHARLNQEHWQFDARSLNDAHDLTDSDDMDYVTESHDDSDRSKIELEFTSNTRGFEYPKSDGRATSGTRADNDNSASKRNGIEADHASTLYDAISARLTNSGLALDTIQNASQYAEGKDFLANNSIVVNSKQRRLLLIRLANALLLDSEEKRIPNQGLDDALNLLDLADREKCDSDPELDALTLATRLMIDHWRGDESRSLDEIKAIDHPVAFANRVRLLFLREQIDEAFDLVHHQELNYRWAEIAAAIYVRKNRLSDAIEICQSMRNGTLKAKEEPHFKTVRYFRCLMMVADEFYRRTFSGRNVGDRIYLDDLTELESKQLKELVDLLNPIVSKAFGAGSVSNGIERQSLEIALDAAHLLGDQERAIRIAKLLESSSPISRKVPQAIRAGYLKADVDILKRLREDWPNSVEVSLSICEITAFYLYDSTFALSELEVLANGDLDENGKSRAATISLSVYERESGELRNRAFSLLARVVGADHHFLRMAEAITAMGQQDWSRAEQLLNDRSAPKDSEWLSLHATVLQRKGDLQSALTDLKKLSGMTSSPSVLQHAVALALKVDPKDFKFANTVLERLAKFPNERKNAERTLAEIGWESGTDAGLLRAAQLYKKLFQECPNEPDLAKNAAICLRSMNEMDQAIALLEDLERGHPEFIEGFLLHADLLETQARSEDAFALLDREAIRTRFWNEPEFLHKYMHLGYLTDHELEAHRAMSQIGAIETGMPEQDKTLQAKSLEQLVEFLQGRRQFSEQIDEMVLRGQSPWTLHPFQEHIPIMSAWVYRTQKLIPWETRAGRAQFSTYASNAFFAKSNDVDERQLEPIEAPKAPQTIVVDISALVTLFKLGLIEKAADYFGTIYVPAAYRDLELFEAKRLQPHQLSRVEQSHRLFELMVRGQLRRPSENTSEVEVVDFQTEADPTSFSVGDVALWLKQSGLVTTERYKQLTASQSFIVSGRDGIASLLTSNRCQFSLFALQTLESAALLDIVVDQYRVTLTASAVRELEQEQFAFEQQARTARESREFWRIIRDNNKFQFNGQSKRNRSAKDSDDEARSDESDSLFRLSLSAYELAKEHGIPLLADDRVLLSMAQNESDGHTCVAFSTLELIPSFENHGSLGIEERLQHTLRLIDWRYRFLKIAPELLLYAAKLTFESGSIPGVCLTKIARYVHDCMLDVGLFGGDENVTPRVSIAIELYAFWTRTVARFINQLWTDDFVTDETAESFTRWAIDSLLPTSPISVRPDVRANMAENQAKLVLVHILSERGANPNTTRSAKLMGVLQEALVMTQSEFYRTVFSLVELVDDGEGTGLSQEKWSRVQQAYRRGIAKHALAPFHHEGGYQVEARGIALLEASKSLRIKPSEQDVPEHVLNVLRDGSDEHVIQAAPHGPLVFHRESDQKSSSVFEASDLLIHPNQKSREAVVIYFRQLARRSEHTMSERLKKAVKDKSTSIMKKRSVNWYPAAEDLMEIIENDWELNLAGFRQVLLTKNQDWIHRYWYRCIRPRFHPASTLPTAAFHACTDPIAMKDRVLPSVSQEAQRNGIVSAYCRHLGHLPLVGDWSLSDFILRTNDAVSEEDLFMLAEHDNYFNAYHGCIALVARWDKLDSDQKNRAANLLSDFICLSRNPDLSSSRGRYWTIANRLANHFLAWIPLYGPELGDDNSASLSWWLAGRLTDVVIEDVEGKKDRQSHMRFVLERNIEPLVHFGFAINQLIRGGATSSVFHANTNLIQQGGPFFASIVASLKHKFVPIYELLNEQAKSEIDQWMFVNTMHQPIGLPKQGSLVFVDHLINLQTVTEAWELAINADAETHVAFGQLRVDCAKLNDENSLELLLSSFGALSVDDQTIWLERMKAAVWRQAIHLNPLLGVLRSPNRSKVLVQSMKIDQLSMTMELFLSIQQFGGEVWQQELPHRLVDWLDFVNLVEEKAIIFNGIVCSSIAGDSPSAIDRVRDRDDFAQLENIFAFQEERLETSRGIVPRWTWSKLRNYLDRLRIDNTAISTRFD